MKNYIFLFSLLFFFFGLTIQSSSQVNNYIYGIDNPSAGNFFFAKAEISSGIVTDLAQIPISVIGSSTSSCVDADGLKYYFCTGEEMMTFDPVTGNLLSNQLLPLPASTQLMQVQFNPCDTTIYGILNNTSLLTSEFVRYEPASNIFTTISSLGIMNFGMGCQAMLDPDSGIYSFFNGNMIGIQISTGQILYNNAVINYPGETFGHVALYCQTHQVYGTSANPSLSTKILSIVDPYTGIVTHVAETGWQAGFMKPALAGSCIDQANHIFYYGAIQRIVGADLLNGNMVYNMSTAPQSLNLIQHFSGCSCHLTSIDERASDHGFRLFPNPANANITLNCGTNKYTQAIIFNWLGEQVISFSIHGTLNFNCSLFPQGIYFVKLQTENDITILKLIKQ